MAGSSDPNFTSITSYYRNTGYNPVSQAGDIAVISLSRPITTITPAKLSGDIPDPGTILFAAGYWWYWHGKQLLPAHR
jgi:hypothetical protein